MEVFRISGETLAVLDSDEFEGKPAKAVKQALAAKVGISRFKQKFLVEDSFREIPDDEVFASAPLKVQLVILDFWPQDAEQCEKMVSASRDNDLGALEELLKCPRNPNEADQDGHTPLHHIAHMGHVSPALLLLEADAKIDQLDSFGCTPLLLAAQAGHINIVRLLVEAGAAKDQADNDGATPLLSAAHPFFIAAQGDHLDIVRLLVEAGAAKDQA
jgi:hypothetical protein